MAWNIVRHAFVIVFGNFQTALRASLVPFAILMGVLLIFSTLFGLPLYQDALAGPSAEQSIQFVFLSFLSIPLYLFIFAWVAVTWHRYILLEDYPSTVPAVANRPIWAYVARTLMLMLQMVVVMIPVIIVVTLISGGDPTAMRADTIMGFLMNVLIGAVFTFFWFRVGVSLPAVAVEKPMDSREAWAATNPVWQTIFGAAVIMVMLNLIVSLAFSMLFTGIPLISYLLSIVIQWVTMMVGVSVLTTLYGHVIEGRPLAD